MYSEGEGKMAKQKTPSIYRLYVVDLQTKNQYRSSDIERSFGVKEVKIEGIDTIFDFSDVDTLDEMSVKYSNFKVLAYSVNANIHIQNAFN